MSSLTMKAIRAHDYGSPEVLRLEQTPRPAPKADEVLIRVRAAGVNPADWKYLSGAYKQFMPLQFPLTPGMEGSGTIEAIGANITSFKKGDVVYGIITGGYAEYALAKANDIQPKSANLTFEEAASLPVGALTAWGAVETAKVKNGQRVLVHGAAGGVGAYVVQLARWKGAHVTGTASTGNIEFARSLGAENVIDYSAVRFETVVHDMDVVIDTVGGELVERSFQVLRPGGVFVTVAGRPAEDTGKAQKITALSAGRASPENLKQISELIEAKQLKPVTGAVFPLADARQALEMSQTGHGRGRIILTVVDQPKP
jgi:NADPH:quinone reductase-like Zn-dependent oxidoreductase